MGAGIESNIILAAKDATGGSDASKPDEHGTFNPSVFTLVATTRKPATYPVTVNKARLALCVNNREALEKYAAELIESLYQGWVDDKNAAVANGINKLINTVGENSISIEMGAGGQDYADKLLTMIKTQVEDIREGVTGESYGNTEIGQNRIAADTVVMVMSNATAALLDTYGYSKAFNETYLQTRNVARVTSNRIPENVVIITDSRNVILHKRWDELVDIKNSNGSYNYFYNVDYFVDVAVGQNSEDPAVDIVGFPIKVLKGIDSAAEDV